MAQRVPSAGMTAQLGMPSHLSVPAMAPMGIAAQTRMAAPPGPSQVVPTIKQASQPAQIPAQMVPTSGLGSQPETEHMSDITQLQHEAMDMDHK